MMLEIKNLTKTYGRFRAVDDMSLSIPKGEIFGFVGPNGAGKTTTMRIICGLLEADKGEIYVDGIDAIRNPIEIKKKVGYVPDYFGTYDNLTAIEYMQFFGTMYRMSVDEVKELSHGLLELVNLSDKEDVFVDSLSRGMKQRLCVARALIHNPDFLILDEPNSGLDPRARFEMKEILKNLGSMGKTIMISSHILPELSEMCTGVGIMEKGKLILSGNVEEIERKTQGMRPLHIAVVGEKDLAVAIIKQNSLVSDVSIREDDIVVNFGGSDEEVSALLSALVAQGIMVSNFYREKGNLEDLFLEMTSHKKGGTR